MDKLEVNVDAIRGKGAFAKLPEQVKMVYYDLAVQAGPDFLKSAPNMRKHLQNGDVQGMIGELRNYYSKPASDYNVRRRRLEANHLEDAVKSGSLKSRF